MSNVQYVNRKIFFTIFYNPQAYKTQPYACASQGNKILIWMNKWDLNKSYKSKNLLLNRNHKINLTTYLMGEILYNVDHRQRDGRAGWLPRGMVTYVEGLKDYAYYSCLGDFQGLFLFSQQFVYIQLQCCNSYFHNYVVMLNSTIVAVVCPCGNARIFNIITKELIEEKKIYEDCTGIRSMVSLKSGIVAASTYEKIEIWQLIDNTDKFSPLLLSKIDCPSNTFLYYDKNRNYLFSGGIDNYIYCYEIDSNLNIQLFLKISIENNNYNKIEYDEEEMEAQDENDDFFINYYKQNFSLEYYLSYVNRIRYIFFLPNGNITGLRYNGDVFNIQMFKA